ncbi:uncharacterized protein LOC120342093 isoform X2 [Styela clava]
MATINMCEFIVDVLLFFNSSINYLIESEFEENRIDLILDKIFSSHWIFLEFQASSFISYNGLNQSIMLKCANILDFCSRHNGVFGSCLLFQDSIVQSLINSKLTRLAQLCVSCPGAFNGQCKQLGSQVYRFVPVFVTVEEYNAIVAKQRRKYGDIEWEPHTWVGYCASSGSDSPKDMPAEQTAESKAQTTDSQEMLACSNTKELSLLVFNEEKTTLLILMDEFSDQYSLNLTKEMVDECLRDLKCIAQELDPELRGEQKERLVVASSSMSGKLQANFVDDHMGNEDKALVSACQDDFNINDTFEEMTLTDTKGVLRFEKSFYCSKFSLDKGMNGGE